MIYASSRVINLYNRILRVVTYVSFVLQWNTNYKFGFQICYKLELGDFKSVKRKKMSRIDTETLSIDKNS